MAKAKILTGEILVAVEAVDAAVSAALRAHEPPISALAAMLACQRIAARCAISSGVAVEQCSVKQVEAYFAEQDTQGPQAAEPAPKEQIQ